MLGSADFASIAALAGDPTRAAMLAALMDGQAYSATELALEGSVSASTASSHLSRLSAGGLVKTVKQGRHRYFRIATPEIAAVLEGLMSLAPRIGPRYARPGPRDPELRSARVCYDHLAGEAAVTLLTRLREQGVLDGPEGRLALTGAGEAWCERIGVDHIALRARRRPLCRLCLDWSERRMHLAGALGAAVLERMFAFRYARRASVGRAIILSARGATFVESPESG